MSLDLRSCPALREIRYLYRVNQDLGFLGDRIRECFLATSRVAIVAAKKRGGQSGVIASYLFADGNFTVFCYFGVNGEDVRIVCHCVLV